MNFSLTESYGRRAHRRPRRLRDLPELQRPVRRVDGRAAAVRR